ncbi:MAG TPA: alpha/beta fold hydrolase [Dehalococcoidia bacterium]|nr:alpha/beta fold hydrolase [Dehalococcoidia bacterium]
MTSPAIRYAKTSDHVRIAYYVTGEGPALVFCSNPLFSLIEEDWRFPEVRRSLELLAQRFTIVRYDSRGCGLSDRNVSEIDLDASIRDIKAVLSDSGISQASLFASFHGGPVAVALAAQSPRLITHLILFHAFARTRDYLETPRVRLISALSRQDWDLYSETITHAMLGWNDGVASRYASLFSASDRESYVRRLEKVSAFDASRFIKDVKVPTLILQRKDFWLTDEGLGKSLASEIPNASLSLIEGSSASMFTEEWYSIVDIISRFIDKGIDAAPSELRQILTPRELEILRGLTDGLSSKQIANHFGLSTHTVERHISNIYDKTGVHGRAALATFAARQGLV